MFALVIEREPLTYRDLPALLATGIQVWGGIAAIGALLWLVFGLLRLPASVRARFPRWQVTAFALCLSLSYLTYVVLACTYIPHLLAAISADSAEGPYVASDWMKTFQTRLWTVAGLLAVLAVGLPFLANLTLLSGRRIGAIARLSFQEAVRRRVLYVFAALLLVFLFTNWYVSSKSEDQVRTFVAVVYYAMTPLLLTSALVLAAWSIPTDIKQQTIHTILTKPVQRLEVVLGRFAGFVGLLTLVLFVMTTVGLVYVLRNIDPEAAEESLKARSPLYGELTFEGTGNNKKAESVGREWDYRTYISGPMPGKQQTGVAIWSFPEVPSALGQRALVPCEFTFDIYRTHKGKENEGVSCSFVFQTRNFRKATLTEYQQRRDAEMKAGQPLAEQNKALDKLAEEFGYFEISSKDLADFHTLTIEVPGGLFRNALKTPEKAAVGGEEPPPAVQVRIQCVSPVQYVGVARHDLYFRADDPDAGNNKVQFALNFYKGACGLWFRLVLVAGLATAMSTYFSGVISVLMACLLYIAGMFQDFIKTVAEGTNVGGGPIEALFRLASRQHMSAPLEQTTIVSVAQGSDVVYRGFIRLLMEILPDVDRFSLTDYVADGFNLPLVQLGVYPFLLLAGYLLPWLVLSFYLMKWREIAAQT